VAIAISYGYALTSEEDVPVCGARNADQQPSGRDLGVRTGHLRFRCPDCGKQFNERSTGLLNRAQYPSDVIALVVFRRFRYKLSLRDLAEMFLIRGFVFKLRGRP
jgi:putative transposase